MVEETVGTPVDTHLYRVANGLEQLTFRARRAKREVLVPKIGVWRSSTHPLNIQRVDDGYLILPDRRELATDVDPFLDRQRYDLVVFLLLRPDIPVDKLLADERQRREELGTIEDALTEGHEGGNKKPVTLVCVKEGWGGFGMVRSVTSAARSGLLSCLGLALKPAYEVTEKSDSACRVIHVDSHARGALELMESALEKRFQVPGGYFR